MSNRLRFGFLLGLLAGTASVASLSIMAGQSNARPAPSTPANRDFEVTLSPDGHTAYLWSIDPQTGSMALLERKPISDLAP